jgi:hypothetical protein
MIRFEHLEDRNAPGSIMDSFSPLAMWGSDLPLLSVLNSATSDLRATTGQVRELLTVPASDWIETAAQVQAKQQVTMSLADLGSPIVGDDLAGILGSLGGRNGGGTVMGPGAIRPGFDSDTLPTCDDCTHPDPSLLGFTMNVSGLSFDSIRVYSNGFIGYINNPDFIWNPGQVGSTDPLSTIALPPDIGEGFLAAPFFADVDLRGAGVVTYGMGDADGYLAWGATWTGVGYYDAHTDLVNTFQIVLIDYSEFGYYGIEFNYGSIQWQAGDFAPALAPRFGYTRANGSEGVEGIGSGEFDVVTDSGSMPLISYDDAFGYGPSGIAGRHILYVA